MIKKKHIVICICAIMVLCNSLSVSATTLPQSISGQEYFNWVNNSQENGVNLYDSISSIKDFEFKIRASVKSIPFTINSSSVSITSYGVVRDANDEIVSNYKGEKYTIDLTLDSFPWTTKSASFTVGSEEEKTITGLSSGKDYIITIRNSNMNFTGTSYYLVGYGSVN